MDRKIIFLLGNSFSANGDEISICGIMLLWSFLLKEEVKCLGEQSLGHTEDAEQVSHCPSFTLYVFPTVWKSFRTYQKLLSVSNTPQSNC